MKRARAGRVIIRSGGCGNSADQKNEKGQVMIEFDDSSYSRDEVDLDPSRSADQSEYDHRSVQPIDRYSRHPGVLCFILYPPKSSHH